MPSAEPLLPAVAGFMTTPVESAGAPTDGGDRLQCCLCGCWFAAISHHARQAHQLSADAYRARAGLPPGAPLDAPALRERKRANAPRPPSRADASTTWEGPIFGEAGVFAHDGDRVQCHVCGGWYKSVASHAYLAHGLTADGYRAMFGLCAQTGLVGTALSERRRELATPRFRAWQPVHAHFVTDQTAEDHARLRREHPLPLEARKDPANQRARSAAGRKGQARRRELLADPEHRRQIGARISAGKGGRVAVACAVCGAPMQVTPSAARSFRQHLCGEACVAVFRERWAKALRQRPRDLHRHALVCQQCGAPFAGRKGQRYCSPLCKSRAQQAKAHRQPAICPGCGTAFAAAPGQRFCSPGCAGRRSGPEQAAKASAAARRRGRPHAETLRVLPAGAFDALPPLERAVVRRYYGLDDSSPASQRELAREHAMATQTVARLVTDAVARLLNAGGLPE